MKKMISSFGNAVLSREQMKKVKGGMCRIYFDTADGGEGSITMNYGASQSAAVSYADSRIGTTQGGSLITGHRVLCDEM